MTTDNKTLADVQPGGRVRLGDQEFAQGCDELRTRTYGEKAAYLEGVAEGRRAALSAQPSPGGQGDARAIIEEFVQCATLGRPHGKLIAQAKDYLAARQPVGEPVAWMTHHDEPMLFPTAAEAAAYCEDDEQPVPLYTAPPAQAVDLGQFRDLAEFALRNAKLHNCWEKREALARELLALIDSQAVRS